MLKRPLMCSIGLLITVALASLISLSVPPNRPVQAASHIAYATPTPDATTILNAANDAQSHAQDLLNVVNTSAAVLGVVLALLGAAAIVLGVFGINNFHQLNTLTNNFRGRLESARTDADNTRQALVYMILADRLLSQRKSTEALETYGKAGRLLPNDAQFQYTLGHIYNGANDYSSAIAALELALTALEKSQPPDTIEQASVLKELGLAYRRKWEDLQDETAFQQAMASLQRSARLNPDDSDTQAVIGGTYRRKGEYQLAADAYYQAWKIDGSSSYALGNLAGLSWKLGKQQEAQTYFGYTEMAATAYIQRGQPEVLWAYYDLALAQLALGKTTEARATYQRAIDQTREVSSFNSVLNNLEMLQQASPPFPGVDEIIRLIKDAKSQV